MHLLLCQEIFAVKMNWEQQLLATQHFRTGLVFSFLIHSPQILMPCFQACCSYESVFLLCIDSTFVAHSHWAAVCLRCLAGVNGASKIAHGLNLSGFPKLGSCFHCQRKVEIGTHLGHVAFDLLSRFPQLRYLGALAWHRRRQCVLSQKILETLGIDPYPGNYDGRRELWQCEPATQNQHCIRVGRQIDVGSGDFGDAMNFFRTRNRRSFQIPEHDVDG